MSNELMIKQSCEEFTEHLASKAPTPGGGGAAALMGSLGIALGNMVGNLTIGKKKYAEVESEIQELNQQADSLRIKLLDMIEQDAEAFLPLSRAYGLPANTEAERAEKNQIMEQALQTAASAPMEIMKLCLESLKVISQYAQIGSRLAISDAGCAAICCRAALESAALNVFVNTRLIQDKQLASDWNHQVDVLRKQGIALAHAIEQLVNTQLREA